ncbi:ABC transporter ATP-binding protein [Vibrio sonorensis]|uniref:ABC transporter ATP-binding protein n=1 Tax=Vibrio sonorensis TaxID=1004316 RepID=UPI0008DAA71B|nr:ABC transporter ATP-binding protein [Vibrio sonorensis]
MIRFEDFSFRYSEHLEGHATLLNVNLTIDKGQCVLLTGGSGSGKSTLIRAINGLVPNYYEGEVSGKIYIDGNNISTIEEKTLYRKVATVYQNPRSQFFTDKVGSELVFSAENFALDVNVIGTLLDRTLVHFNLVQRENEKLEHLSSGEKQRVACASASLIQPELILLDEPSANLDAKTARILAQAIALWKQQGMTIVIAEHRNTYLEA